MTPLGDLKSKFSPETNPGVDGARAGAREALGRRVGGIGGQQKRSLGDEERLT